MIKYKQVFSEMLEYNRDLFESFRSIHSRYELDPESLQLVFNEEGEKVLRVIRRYENTLCGKSESGKYGKFSSSLSEKFWGEIRFHFPKIDSIGKLSS